MEPDISQPGIAPLTLPLAPPQECTSAPRLLRPVKMDGGHYGAWGNYATSGQGEDGGEDMGRVMASGRQRSEGSIARRARRREVIAQRRALQKEEQARIKAAVRDSGSEGELGGQSPWICAEGQGCLAG